MMLTISSKKNTIKSFDNIYINRQSLIYILYFLFIIEPRIFTQYKITTLIFAGANVLIFVNLFLHLIKRKKTKLKNTLFVWIVFCVYSLLAKIISGDLSFLTTWGYLSILVSNIIMIFDDSIYRKDINILLKSILIVGILYLGINVLTFIIYDRGIIRSNFFDTKENDWYFLGIKVAYTDYVFAFFSCGFSYFYLTKKRVLFLIIVILCALNIFIPKISTSIIAFFLIFILFFLVNRTPKLNFKMWYILAFTVILNFLFVFCNASSLFGSFFNIFGKDSTMSSRTIIWTEAKEVLFKNPLRLFCGYGSLNDGNWVPHANGLWNSHNFLLQNLHEIGIVGIFILFYFINYITNSETISKKIKKLNNYLLAMCFVISITSITNGMLNTCYGFIPFLLIKYINCYYSSSIKETNY